MSNIEKVIKKNGREEFYSYYLSLGYDHKTAASLALFTYGNYTYSRFSIDELYAALCRGEDYLPPELLERRRAREEQMRKLPKISSSGRGGLKGLFGGITGGRVKSSVPEEDTMQLFTAPISAPASAPAPAAKSAPACAPPSMYLESDSSAISLTAIGGIDDSYFDADQSFAAAAPAEPSPMYESTGPSLMDVAGALGFATDEYDPIEEKDARSTTAEPTSTFRMTTNTASAGVIFNQLRSSRRIDRSMVRIEEMLNYFRYDSALPESEMFNINCEIMDVASQAAKKYLYINVQGREEVKDRQNIVILLDVSGSMSGNAAQTQAAIATIVSKLGNGDRLSLVTYSDNDHVELEAVTINGAEDRIRVLEKLLSIQISGCTWGSKGIESAYEIGKKNFIKGGNNQVILITDGDLNFGITDKGGLEELIELKKKDNLFLSVIGTGLWNYKDDKLEVLSKHGNGVYRVVNNLNDVKKSIDEEYSSLVNIIAKDVKAQVEFNPEVVESYRLLGFENRTLAREDFTNDKVISEPFGSGGYGVALYELTMKTDDAPVDSGLKYSKVVTTGSGEPGTVKVRYKEPLADVSHELEKVIETAEESYTDNLRLAFVAYVCAEKLRGSDKISSQEIDLAKRLYKELGEGVREKNSADLYKLGGILDKSAKELGVGIPEEPFIW